MTKKSQEIIFEDENRKMQETIEIFSNLIEEIIAETADPATSGILIFNLASEQSSIFLSKKEPKIKFKDYLLRIARYTEAEHTVFIQAMIYIDRLLSLERVTFNMKSIHR